MLIEKMLSDRFLVILSWHGNTLWALERLEWEVFQKSYFELESLSAEEQWDVRNFMGALRRIYGGEN